MRFARRKAQHAFAAETRREAIDEIGEIAKSPSCASCRSKPIWLCARVSARRTQKRMTSKPYPGSSGSASESAFRRKSRSSASTWREGAPVSKHSARTAPSARKKRASKARPPCPRFSRMPIASAISGRRTFSIAERSRKGSAKRRSTMHSGKARKGVMRASSRPRMRVSRRIVSSPKRAVSAALERSARSPNVVRPARVSATLVSLGASSAAMESGRAKNSSSPGGATAVSPKRASARAASGVPATAARPEKERRAIVRKTYVRIAASPPKRCAQPVASSMRPQGGSSATSGVNCSQKAASRSISRSSAAASACATARWGARALASASVMPGVKPSAIAFRSSASMRSALRSFLTRTSGASSEFASGCLRRDFVRRSADRKGSHRAR